MRFRAILDHGEIMLFGNLVQPIHIDGVPEQMHRNDGARARRDQALNQVKIEVPGLPFGIDRHRDGVGVDDRKRGCDIGARAEQDFIARLQVERRDRKM